MAWNSSSVNVPARRSRSRCSICSGIDGAFEEYARRVDPSGVTFANMPTHRLDVHLAPSALAAAPATTVTRVTSTPNSPYSSYQNMVMETLAPRTPGEAAPVGQGDENSTDESDEPAAPAAH